MILVAAALLLWIFGFLALWRVPVCRRYPPFDSAPKDISVIIPARNEEHNLPRLLESLRQQDLAAVEIIVVDDASEDGTAVVAAEKGARVISSLPLPEGWRGKTWACHQGVRASSGYLLVFMDADTWLEPGGLRKLAGAWASRGGAVSVMPYHETGKAYEDLSIFFNLIMAMGVGSFTILGRRRSSEGLFGQVMLVDRESYRQGGGHEAVRGHTLENMFMAGRFMTGGVTVSSFGGRGAVGMRMYPGGLGELIEGWSKAFISGAARVSLPMMISIVAWITGGILAATLLILALLSYSSASPLWLLPYPLFCLQIGAMAARLGSFGSWACLLYPVPLGFYFAVLTRAALRRTRGRDATWKGRRIMPAGKADDAD